MTYFYDKIKNAEVTYPESDAFYNVRDYGAVGDGSIDDSAAFAAAINSIPASDSSNTYYKLWLEPKKTYYITTAINLDYKKVIVEGNGATITTKDSTNSIFYKTTHDNAPLIRDCNFQGKGKAIELTCSYTANEKHDLDVNDCRFQMSGSFTRLTGAVSNQTTLTGTITNTASSATVTGSGTAFNTELAVGDIIDINGEFHTVKTIGGATTLTTLKIVTAPNSGITIYKVSNNTVTGSGTAFLTETAVQGYIKIGDYSYRVKSIASDNSLTIFGCLLERFNNERIDKVNPAYGIYSSGARGLRITRCDFDDFIVTPVTYSMIGIWETLTIESHITNCFFQHCLQAIDCYGTGIDTPAIGNDAYDAGMRLYGCYIQRNTYGVRAEEWDLLEINGGLLDLNLQTALEGYVMNQLQAVNVYIGNTNNPCIILDGSVRNPTNNGFGIHVMNCKIRCHDDGGHGIFGAIYMNGGDQYSFIGNEIQEWRGYGIHYTDIDYMKIHSCTVKPLTASDGIYSIYCPSADSDTNELFNCTYDKTISASSILINGCRKRTASGIVRGELVQNFAIPTGTSGDYSVNHNLGHTITYILATPKGAVPPNWYIKTYGATQVTFNFGAATDAGLSFDVMCFDNSSKFLL